jgi:hypothetical protein
MSVAKKGKPPPSRVMVWTASADEIVRVLPKSAVAPRVQVWSALEVEMVCMTTGVFTVPKATVLDAVL